MFRSALLWPVAVRVALFGVFALLWWFVDPAGTDRLNFVASLFAGAALVAALAAFVLVPFPAVEDSLSARGASARLAKRFVVAVGVGGALCVGAVFAGVYGLGAAALSALAVAELIGLALRSVRVTGLAYVVVPVVTAVVIGGLGWGVLGAGVLDEANARATKNDDFADAANQIAVIDEYLADGHVLYTLAPTDDVDASGVGPVEVSEAGDGHGHPLFHGPHNFYQGVGGGDIDAGLWQGKSDEGADEGTCHDDEASPQQGAGGAAVTCASVPGYNGRVVVRATDSGSGVAQIWAAMPGGTTVLIVVPSTAGDKPFATAPAGHAKQWLDALEPYEQNWTAQEMYDYLY